MDPILNPYAPGAGTQPPALTGRDEVREGLRIALARIKAGRAAKSVILVGLRGVGKTVLLNQMLTDAEGSGLFALFAEAPENRSLPAVLAPQLRGVLIRLSRSEQAKDLAERALRALAGFVNGLKVTYQDISVGLDREPIAGLADNGDLEHDLQQLLVSVGQAAAAAGTVVVVIIDELQYVKEDELAALVTALHRCAQRNVPVALVGAGLPQLPGKMGKVKSYAERLFDFRTIGALERADAVTAIVAPATAESVEFEQAAIAMILDQTKCYPYFLQEWGKHCWDVAQDGKITAEDVEQATISALNALDESFFRVRFDRSTPSEKRYLRAMAELGPGPHRSGDIAKELGREVQSVAPTRSSMIKKGMVWSPSHGDTAFTVPMFDAYMRRIIPGDDWR